MIYLRPARSTDAGTIGAILSEFVATTDWMPELHTGAEDVAHAGQMIERGWVTVAEEDNTVLGFAACNAGDLDALYVAGRARRQGVGSGLLAHLKEHHARLELSTFQANTRAQVFYLRHGFAEVTRTDGAATDEKLPDIQFLWQREAG